MHETYSLNDLAAMSGLSARTLRNHLKLGLLQGEKTDKGHCFTAEQISDFFAHPSVAPTIRSKHRAAIFDFLSNKRKRQASACLILDLPQTDGVVLSRRLSQLFNQSDAGDDATFSYACTGGYSRVILTGHPDVILPLAQSFSKDN